MPKIEACLKENGLGTLDDCRKLLEEKGIDVEGIVKGVQPICFENAVWGIHSGHRYRCEARPEERFRVCCCHRRGPGGIHRAWFCCRAA